MFYHLCYEGNVDLEVVKDPSHRQALEVQIMEFGQVPKQVFNVPHPRRKLGIPLLTEPYQVKEDESQVEGRTQIDQLKIILNSQF